MAWAIGFALALAFRKSNPGQSQLQANTFGLAWLLAWSEAMHITIGDKMTCLAVLAYFHQMCYKNPYMPYRPFYNRQSTRAVPLTLGNHTIQHSQKTAAYRKTPVKCMAVTIYGTADSSTLGRQQPNKVLSLLSIVIYTIYLSTLSWKYRHIIGICRIGTQHSHYLCQQKAPPTWWGLVAPATATQKPSQQVLKSPWEISAAGLAHCRNTIIS